MIQKKLCLPVCLLFSILLAIGPVSADIAYNFYDQCGNGVGWSSNPQGRNCNIVDCCGWDQTWHVHDLGQIMTAYDLTLTATYYGGWTSGCIDHAYIYISSDGSSWSYLGDTDYTPAWTPTYKSFNLIDTPFRYVKVGNYGSCLTDYSDAGVIVNQQNPPEPQVPEFSAIAAGIALAGSALGFIALRRRN